MTPPLAAGWQDPTTAAVVAAAGAADVPARAFAVGSAADGSVDALSDLDLALVPSAGTDGVERLARPDWLAPVGAVWAWQQGTRPDGRVLRVVFADGRRVDLLLVRSADQLPPPVRAVDAAAAQPGALTGDPPVGTGVPEASSVPEPVNDARFHTALALAKLGRRDVLIGAHLALEVARQTLVLSMLIRDRETGTTVHRAGTGRDRDAAAVASALAGLPADADPTAWIDLLERLRAPFDAAAALLWPDHVVDWRAADVLAATARAHLRAAIGSAP